HRRRVGVDRGAPGSLHFHRRRTRKAQRRNSVALEPDQLEVWPNIVGKKRHPESSHPCGRSRQGTQQVDSGRRRHAKCKSNDAERDFRAELQAADDTLCTSRPAGGSFFRLQRETAGARPHKKMVSVEYQSAMCCLLAEERWDSAAVRRKLRSKRQDL